jgi:hypothetical protein
MYYTNSLWSHLSIIVKDDEVIHATLSGVVRQSFYDLCDDQSYVRIRYPKDKDIGLRAASRSAEFEGLPYAWSETISTFLLIIFGIEGSYRLSFFLDFAILLLPIAALGLWIPILFWIPVVTLTFYGSVVLFNILKRRILGTANKEEQPLFESEPVADKSRIQ